MGLQNKQGYAPTMMGMLSQKCSAIYNEMKQEAAHGHTGNDIFFEQLYTCGMFGFTNFFHKSWLNKVMQEQDSSGCFKIHLHAKGGRKLLDHGQNDWWSKNGCSIHKSSVALCAMSVFLRDLAFKVGTESSMTAPSSESFWENVEPFRDGD